ncbi:PPE family protein [Mycobacterium tuberculosis]|nr:PPE family protein [Mycobacterium tuberculosis]
MTFPMWFAVPPEVPSAWLSTGMGPGPLLAAARAWHALAAQYTEIATELASVLAAVQASSWQGPSADRFVVAHQPFRYWLTHAATVATAAAAAHETAAAGYTSALGGMPTLAELAANHAMHGALVTTNFFGVNTIPIALNEADYLRMWIQAATVMSHYQAVAHESVAATPSTPPAPQIVTSAASSAASSSFPDPTKLILQLLKDFLELLRYLAVELLPGPLGDLIAQVLDWFISFVSGPVFTFLAYLVLDPLIYFGPFAPLTSPVLLPAGLTGFAGLGAVSGPAGPMVERVHSDGPSRQSWPAATGVTLVGTNPAALVTTPAPAPTTSAAPTAPSTPGSSRPRPLRGRWSRRGRVQPDRQDDSTRRCYHRCRRTCRQTARRPSSEQRQQSNKTAATSPATPLRVSGRRRPPDHAKHTGDGRRRRRQPWIGCAGVRRHDPKIGARISDRAYSPRRRIRRRPVAADASAHVGRVRLNVEVLGFRMVQDERVGRLFGMQL